MRPAVLSIAFALLVGLSTVLAQGPASGKRSGLEVADLETLVTAGFSDQEIVAHAERRGWPPALDLVAVSRLESLGAGPLLRGRLLGRISSEGPRAALERTFETVRSTLPDGRSVLSLAPRGWRRETSEDGRRSTWARSPAGPWFSRTTVFLWIFDRNGWTEDRAAAFGKVVFSGVREGLARDGLETGETGERVVRHPDSELAFPYFDVVARDPRRDVRGLVALTVRVLESEDLVMVAGVTAPTDRRAVELERPPQETLTWILGSIEISPPALAEPRRAR